MNEIPFSAVPLTRTTGNIMKKEKKDITISILKEKYDKKNEKINTTVESDTGKRPAKDTNPLPPNPNKVDNH